MPRCVIGYIYNEKFLAPEQKSFLKLAKRHNAEIMFFNLGEDLYQKELENKVRKCDILINRTDEVLAIEIIKTAEEFGKKVVETSKSFYYSEDKWMLYIKCREYNIPTPETILLPVTLPGVKKELLEFNHWPVVLKRLDGSEGRCVEKADTINQAQRIISRYWKKEFERMPIIAQEFIKSYSYRVLVMDGKIVQSEIKKGKGWKLTGVYTSRFSRFKVDNELRKIVKKLSDVTKIKVLGIDLLKRDGKWFVNDVNAEPCFADFRSELDFIVTKAINLLKRNAAYRGKAS